MIVRVPDGYKPASKDCPVCDIAFRSRADVSNFQQHGCCLQCDINFRYPNLERWKQGWRPAGENNDKEQMDRSNTSGS
jgi:hypothetical protein